MSVIALKCPEINVTVVDLNKERIDAWNNKDLSKLPIYEPGLDKVIAEARGRNLFFSTDVDNAINKSRNDFYLLLTLLLKPTVKEREQAADLKYVEFVC